MKPKPARRAPAAASADVSRRMARTRGRDTKPELLLRSELHRRGRRFRVDQPLLVDRRRRADIVFRRAKVAVFVDGCFWHGCPVHASWPKHNAQFWREKIERNRQRDRETDDLLRAAGWKVVRVWEHVAVVTAADEVEAALDGPREQADLSACA